MIVKRFTRRAALRPRELKLIELTGRKPPIPPPPPILKTAANASQVTAAEGATRQAIKGKAASAQGNSRNAGRIVANTRVAGKQSFH